MNAADFQLWRDDFRREVEQVLARMRQAPASSGGSAAMFPGELAALLAEEKTRSAALKAELAKAREELSLQALLLKRETARRERLKGLCAKLSWALESLRASRGAS